jgi:hypothetical protein
MLLTTFKAPRQIFKKPHPKRPSDISSDLKLQQCVTFLKRSSVALRTISGQPVGDIYMTNDRLFAVGASRALVTPQCLRYLDWGNLDNSLRLCSLDSSKEIAVYDNVHIGHITVCAIVGHETVITGGNDSVIANTN